MYKVIGNNKQIHVFRNSVLNTIASNRGLIDIEELTPSEHGVTDINKLKNIDNGSRLLYHHIQSGSKILGNMDLDCDGVTSASMFYTAMVSTFNHPVDKLSIFTNERRYKRGINDEVLKVVNRFKPDLFITADHGSGDNDYIKILRDKGIDVIITDHHLFDKYPTYTNVFLNPQQEGCRYDKTISGAVVLYLLLLKTTELIDNECIIDYLLPFCAISTLGDRMDMSIKTNRYLVQEGIYQINTNPLWSYFKKVYGKGREISQTTLDFEIIPGINSGGRMGNSRLGFNMLTNLFLDKVKFDKDVRLLREVNIDRKKIQSKFTKLAYIEYNRYKEHFNKSIVIRLDEPNGVNGLVASNLVNKYGKPTIVGSVRDGVIYSSARSVAGVRFKELVGKCNVVAKGHQYAFGVSINDNDYLSFISRLNNELSKIEIPEYIHNVDMVLYDNIGVDLVKSLTELEPFGTNFEKPKFVVSGNIIDKRLIGKNKEHMIFKIWNNSGYYEAIWFNADLTYKIDHKGYDIVCELSINNFNKSTVQLIVHEIVASKKG